MEVVGGDVEGPGWGELGGDGGYPPGWRYQVREEEYPSVVHG